MIIIFLQSTRYQFSLYQELVMQHCQFRYNDDVMKGSARDTNRKSLYDDLNFLNSNIFAVFGQKTICSIPNCYKFYHLTEYSISFFSNSGVCSPLIIDQYHFILYNILSRYSSLNIYRKAVVYPSWQ